jgi:hypothetical protein
VRVAVGVAQLVRQRIQEQVPPLLRELRINVMNQACAWIICPSETCRAHSMQSRALVSKMGNRA